MRTLPVVETLQSLIETCSDAAHRFATCAEHAANPVLRTFLNECLKQRKHWSEELQLILNPLQDQQAKAGHMAWPLHAGWISVRCAFSPENRDALVIEECRRGEQVAMARYEETLKQILAWFKPAGHEVGEQAPERLDALPGMRSIETIIRRHLSNIRQSEHHIASFETGSAKMTRLQYGSGDTAHMPQIFSAKLGGPLSMPVAAHL